jgi:hypothetical protein
VVAFSHYSNVQVINLIFLLYFIGELYVGVYGVKVV